MTNDLNCVSAKEQAVRQSKQNTQAAARSVFHRTLDLDGIKIFYRDPVAEDAPVVLLPHGYPCSSYEFRNFIPALADRWRLIAPDFPGCGYSDTPEDFAYNYDGYVIVWGPQDEYMPEGSARAYLRDLPDAELHLLDGGHWALETNLEEIVTLARDFLERVHGPR
jgi:pimeloyl-ACP methyl ester carboxylesterase